MSKKTEQQKQRKQQMQEAARRRAVFTSWGLRGALLVLVPLVVFVLVQGFFRSASSPPPSAVGPDDHVRGLLDAELTITMYADFECPACFQEVQLLSRAWPQLNGRAKLVFRHFPLDTHRNAFTAARYAEAAGRQDKFWVMHDLLFANQGIWAGMEDVESLFDSYALEMNLDLARLHADINDPALRDKILSDQQGGIRAGVRSTPSLFLNGKRIDNPRTTNEFMRLAEAALNDEL